MRGQIRLQEPLSIRAVDKWVAIIHDQILHIPIDDLAPRTVSLGLVLHELACLKRQSLKLVVGYVRTLEL